jgi:hypothetical protein
MLAEVVDAVIGIDTHRDSHEVEIADAHLRHRPPIPPRRSALPGAATDRQTRRNWLPTRRNHRRCTPHVRRRPPLRPTKFESVHPSMVLRPARLAPCAASTVGVSLSIDTQVSAVAAGDAEEVGQVPAVPADLHAGVQARVGHVLDRDQRGRTHNSAAPWLCR